MRNSGSRRQRQRYGAVAQILHWGMAAALGFLVWFGFELDSIRDGTLLGMDETEAYIFHRSLGFTLGVLAILRLAWRFIVPPPPMPASMAGWERLTAHLSHAGFYVIMIGMPVAGWVMSSAQQFRSPIEIFGLFTLPHIVEPDRQLQRSAGEVHRLMGWAFLILLGLHVAGALKHSLFDRAGGLGRMLPFGRP